MTQTSLGGVSNSSSKVFSNAKGSIALVNYGKLQGAISSYDFNMQNSNSSNNKNNTNNTNNVQSTWSGTYTENKIW